jgi:P27 family predicted phage terminase small subunit
MRGRKPSPLSIHRLEETFDAEPIASPAAGVPTDAPNHLDEIAQAEWHRVTALGTWSAADRATVATHCAAYSHLVEAERELQQHGKVVTMPSGAQRPSPWLTIFKDSAAIVQRCAAELGLSPVARTRLRVKDTEPKTAILKRDRRA